MSTPDSPQPCQPPSATRSDRLALAAVMGLVAALSVWVHSPAVRNSFVQWDDNVHLAELDEHPRLSWSALRWAFTATEPYSYYPLTRLANVANHHFWHEAAAGYHASSVGLHALCAALVTLLAWTLGQVRAWRTQTARLALAAGAGLVFGIHPLQVQAVAWMSQQMTVLSGLFSVVSVWAYLKFAVAETGNAQFRWNWWTLTTLAYFAALLSKPVAASLALVMLLLDFYPLRRHLALSWRRLLGEKWLWILLSVGASVQLLLLGARHAAVVDLNRFNLGERLLLVAHNVVFYLGQWLWPVRLSPHYPFTGTIAWSEPSYLLPALGVTVATAGVLVFARRWPVGVSVWGTYLALLLPVSGIVGVGNEAAADRYMYLSMLPLLVLVGGGVAWAWTRLGWPGRSALGVLLCCYLLFLGYRTHAQIAVWRNDETLWRAALEYAPDSGMANRQLATALQRQGRFDAALPFAQRTVAVTPQIADAHATLGTLYWEMGRYQDAIGELEQALRLEPDAQRVLYFLARCEVKIGRLGATRAALQQLVRLNPTLYQSLRQEPEFAGLAGEF